MWDQMNTPAWVQDSKCILIANSKILVDFKEGRYNHKKKF